MPIVEQSDIEAILGRTLTPDEENRVDRLTEMAEAQLESALPGFSIVAATATAEEIVHDDPDVAWTARFPVTDVVSVSIGAGVLTASSYTWTDKGQIVLGQRCILNEFEVNVPAWSSSVPLTVTYGYGLDPLPADLAAAVATPIAALLRQQATNPDGVRSESLGAYAVSFFDLSPTGGLTAVSPASLRRWSRTRQLSVPLARYR